MYLFFIQEEARVCIHKDFISKYGEKMLKGEMLAVHLINLSFYFFFDEPKVLDFFLFTESVFGLTFVT